MLGSRRSLIPSIICTMVIAGGAVQAADATAAASATASVPAPTGATVAVAANPAYAPVVPAVPRDPVLSPFGIGSSAQRSKDHPDWLPQMAAIGIRDIRTCYGGWGIEQTEGVFDYTTLDERLAYVESLGVTSGMMVNGVPKWDTKDKPGYLPLNNLEAWSTMITALCKHTAGHVSHLEIWNEPPNGTHGSTGEDYAKVVLAAYDAAKAGDPKIQVGMAAKSGHINYLDNAIKAGAKDHFDYIIFHPYELLGTVCAHPGSESVFMAIVPKVRKMLAAQDPDRIQAPVWFTEVGADTKHGVDKQAFAVIKAYVMGIAEGVACIEWFEGMDGDSGPMGLLDGKAKPRPAYTALAKLIELVGRHPTYLGWVLFNDHHYGFVFQGVKGPVLATWAGTDKAEDVDFGAPVTIIDPPTGTTSQAQKVSLTEAPILVTGIPDALVAQAKADKDKPFPWGGDYTSATSVSVTMGATNVENGLHTMAADSIAADVIAYGGNARAGSVPGGNVFMVDPNFLSYTTVPIEITVVARRNEKNDPAKLTLEYESTVDSNYKKGETLDIPDNKDWHKLTWKIDDDRFIGTWAYNFKFNSGKYFVQSVTVTKLAK